MQSFTGLQYLKIDIANSFGLDKQTWNQRLTWFEQNAHQLDTLLSKAKEPALYYAGVSAYRKTLAGEPTGYPVSLDATSSGLQLLAALTCDRQAATLCNVISVFDEHKQPERRDGYTIIYNRILTVTGGAAKINRDDTKQAIMTALYSSTAMPKKIFGAELLPTFESVMEASAPAAWELNKAFRDIWNPETAIYEWKLPDNFHVQVKVMAPVKESVNFLNEPFEVHRKVNAPTKTGRSLGANTVHSLDGMVVREMIRRCNYDAAWVETLKGLLAGENDIYLEDARARRDSIIMVKMLWANFLQSGYLSARILEHLNSDSLAYIEPVDRIHIQELINSLPETPFQVIAVHDCFRCLPNHANDMRAQYIRQLYLIARSNLLNYLLSQLVGRETHIEKMDPEMAEEVLQTEYALS